MIWGHKKGNSKIFCLIFINSSSHFCPFTTELNQTHWEHLFSQLERNSNKRHSNWMHLFHCTWWTSWKWFHHNIRKLIKDDEFVNSMNDLELCTWTSFVGVVKDLWGNRQAKNYKKLAEKMLKSLQDIGTNMSIKVHFMHSHLDKFLNNYDNVSYEHGDLFYQDIKITEKCYQGQMNDGWLLLEYQKGLK